MFFFFICTYNTQSVGDISFTVKLFSSSSDNMSLSFRRLKIMRIFHPRGVGVLSNENVQIPEIFS